MTMLAYSGRRVGRPSLSFIFYMFLCRLLLYVSVDLRVFCMFLILSICLRVFTFVNIVVRIVTVATDIYNQSQDWSGD